MPLWEVRVYPDPVLKGRSDEVSAGEIRVMEFAIDLVATLNAHPGCVGLAAPQVGRAWRVIAVDASRYRKDPGRHHGLMVLVNPEITRAEGAQVVREGCLSVPHFTGNVHRAARLTVEGFDPAGKKVGYECCDMEAVILQHEMDHLNGLLFLDRIISRKSDLFPRKRYL